jgi:hypothetical protein
MKTLADKSQVSSTSYYYLLDWNDQNNKKVIFEKFKKESLYELTLEEYRILWLYATTEEYNKMK